MKSKVLLLDDDPREILAFQQIFSNEFDYVISPSTHLNANQGTEIKPSEVLRGFDGIELLLAKSNDEALSHVQSHLQDEVPISVLFISINHHKAAERIAFAQTIREIDARVYVVILTDASGQAFSRQLESLQSLALVLKKPFEIAEIKQLTSHFIQAWQKDVSLVQLQEQLKNKVLEKLFEASMYDLINPVLLSLTDKVNGQTGLLDFLRNHILPTTEDKQTFDEVTQRLHEDSLALTKTIRVMQQLFSAWDEVTVFSVKTARQRIFSLIPELQNLPDDIEFKIELNVDPELTLSLPVNLLMLSITSLVRNALQSVNRKLLDSKQAGQKGYVLLHSEMTGDQHLQLTIADNGEGFDPEQMGDSGRFLEGNVNGGYLSEGVGFSVVNAFVEKVKGSFSLTSEGKGKGAVAKLVFPLSIHQV